MVFLVFMEQNNKTEPWWKSGVEIFGQVSAWVVVPIVLALIAGKYLDGLYGTKPWIFLGLSLIGFIISSFGIVFVITKYIRKITEEKSSIDSNQKNGKSNQPK